MTIHPTSVVHPSARLAAGVEIGPFCLVGPEVELGPGTRLLGRVSIIGRVRLGASNVLHPTCMIGGAPQDHEPAAPDALIEIGDNNVFREAVTLNQPKVAGHTTSVGSGCRFLYASHVAHDCAVKDDVVIGECSTLGGHAVVEACSWIEPLAAIHQYVTVGRHCRLRTHSAISEDAPPFMEYDGLSNRPVGPNRDAWTRAGLGPGASTAIEDAYVTVWKSGLTRPEAIAHLEASPVEVVREIAAFLRRSGDGRMGRRQEGVR